jgi:putative nucleotidyltransferase with HDIG domain
MAYACGWLLASEWIVVTTEIWHASWWIYHVLLVAAIVALLVGVARQYAGNASLSNITRGLFIVDPVERIEVGLSEGVRALVRATEAHDSYTGGHSYRVALTAVRIGQRMGLPAVDLRALAQGGLVHDVGKMEIPDRVLNKPGSLSEEEMELVRQHPEAGYRMCQNLGFMQEELEIVRYHHERYDGSGYPDGLEGEGIPIHARILAVADVYDALTSERSYRESWSHSRARKWILEERGGKFGPACVEAWASLTEEGPVVAAAEQPRWTTGVTATV